MPRKRKALSLFCGLAAVLCSLSCQCDRPARPAKAPAEQAATQPAAAPQPSAPAPRPPKPAAFGAGRLERVNGYTVLHLAGTPEQMGEQHGRLLKNVIPKVVQTVVRDANGSTPEEYKLLIDGARAMEKYLPDAFRRELKALAAAAEVPYDELVALQLFGDVNRGNSMYCSTYAVLGKATATGECFVGRNMDYWDYGVMRYGAVLIHFQPDDGIPFFTVSWAGIINGWTAMNAKCIVVANNTAYGAKANSTEGLSTCFMLRKIVQYCDTVVAGVKTIRTTPRSCGTTMIVAGGNPPKAAEVEYDHDAVAVRWANNGYICATNGLRRLYQDPPMKDSEGWSSRYLRMVELIKSNHGRIDEAMNFVADPQVYMGINLHSALLCPQSLRFRLAMGRQPAAEGPYECFVLTPKGIVAD